MPFKGIGKNKYKSPSGRTYTDSQIRLYYSLGGRFPFRGETNSSAAHSTKEGRKQTDNLGRRVSKK
jgi:hypothetical protein